MHKRAALEAALLFPLLMATLHLWETVRATTGLPVVRLDDRMAHQVVDFSSGEAKSNPFAPTTSIVTARSDVDCAILIGANPTADANAFPLKANEIRDFYADPGSVLSVVAT